MRTDDASDTAILPHTSICRQVHVCTWFLTKLGIDYPFCCLYRWCNIISVALFLEQTCVCFVPLAASCPLALLNIAGSRSTLDRSCDVLNKEIISRGSPASLFLSMFMNRSSLILWCSKTRLLCWFLVCAVFSIIHFVWLFILEIWNWSNSCSQFCWPEVAAGTHNFSGTFLLQVHHMDWTHETRNTWQQQNNSIEWTVDCVTDILVQAGPACIRLEVVLKVFVLPSQWLTLF